MLSSTQLHSFGHSPCHLFSHAAEVAPRFLQVAPIIQPAQFGHAIVIVLGHQMILALRRKCTSQRCHTASGNGSKIARFNPG